LKLALVTDAWSPQVNGVVTTLVELVRALHERGHEVHLFCQDEQPLRRESLGFMIHGISTQSYAPRRSADERSVLNKNLNYGLAIMHKLAALYAEGLIFDVVHASNWDCEAAALIRSRVYPTVLMLVSPLAQVIATEQWQPNDDLGACVALDRWQIANADTICVPSEGVLTSYRKLMDIRSEGLARLRLAPLGIVPVGMPGQLRADGRRRLLFVGRCERRKGAHTLLDVLPALLARYPDWECHMVGNDQVALAEGGTLKERFLSLHHDAPWIGRVIFHGNVGDAELHEHYRDCDLFVAPSLFESFGLIYHEAMQYGKAVVGCRTGGVPEVVEHGVEGLLVAPGDAGELGAALAQLMGDHALRRRLGEAGARRVHQRHNYRTMAKRMEEVYFETIANADVSWQTQRERVWPRDLPLFADSELVAFRGPWLTQEAVPGQRYRLGQAGAELTFETNGGATLRLVALRHDWSGILEITADQKTIAYLDLFTLGDMQLSYTTDIGVPGSIGEQVTITLRVHHERNPASHATQVWLKQVTVFPQPTITMSRRPVQTRRQSAGVVLGRTQSVLEQAPNRQGIGNQ